MSTEYADLSVNTPVEIQHCPHCGSRLVSYSTEPNADASNQSPGADLAEHLFVAQMKAEEIVLTYSHRIRFTLKDIAFILRTGETTIKEAIASGKLKKSPAGGIMKTALIEWLGGDPIEEYLRQAVMLKDGLRDLNRKITAAPPPILPPTTDTSV